MSNLNDEILAVLKRHRNEIAEYVDSIQLLATWMENGETRYAFIGAGNLFARQAMAVQYAELDVALTTEGEDEEDGEEWMVND